jgi:hypothetical protein
MAIPSFFASRALLDDIADCRSPDCDLAAHAGFEMTGLEACEVEGSGAGELPD